MKHIFILHIIALAFYNALCAQSISPTLLSPVGGETTTADGTSFTFSVGEVAVAHVYEAEVWLTQGFQQPGSEKAVEPDTTQVKQLDYADPINVFTPGNADGKGLNETFRLLEWVNKDRQKRSLSPYLETELSIAIVNRWGELVFKADPYQDWDGTFNGRELPTGTYYYTLQVRSASKPVLRGPVQLLR